MNIAFALLVIICISCQKNNDPFLESIQHLNSLLEHRAFLDEMYQRDQSLFRKRSELLLQYGQESEEYRAYESQVKKNDSINVIYMETYFKYHPYPKKKEVGEYRSNIPCAILQHQTNTEKRLKYTPMLYSAYRDNDLKAHYLTAYLKQTYASIFGQEHKMKRPFTAESEIEHLMKELGIKS